MVLYYFSLGVTFEYLFDLLLQVMFFKCFSFLLIVFFFFLNGNKSKTHSMVERFLKKYTIYRIHNSHLQTQII